MMQPKAKSYSSMLLQANCFARIMLRSDKADHLETWFTRELAALGTAEVIIWVE